MIEYYSSHLIYTVRNLYNGFGTLWKDEVKNVSLSKADKQNLIIDLLSHLSDFVD